MLMSVIGEKMSFNKETSDAFIAEMTVLENEIIEQLREIQAKDILRIKKCIEKLNKGLLEAPRAKRKQFISLLKEAKDMRY